WIDIGQPEEDGKQGGLHSKDEDEHCAEGEGDGIGSVVAQANRQVCHVEGSIKSVKQSRRAEKHGAGKDVEDDELGGLAQLACVVAVRDKDVAGKEHDLETDEEVEEVAGDERPVHAGTENKKHRMKEDRLLRARDRAAECVPVGTDLGGRSD